MKETDMLNAWLWDQHRTDLQWRRVRLGVLPTKEMARMYMTILRWVDAIVIKEGIVYIIEAKVRPMPGAVGQLELYRDLFYQTPEFEQYKNYPSKLILLTAESDLNMIEMCSKKDITYYIFTEDDVNRVRREMMLPVI